jgi:hypothetical protein
MVRRVPIPSKPTMGRRRQKRFGEDLAVDGEGRFSVILIEAPIMVIDELLVKLHRFLTVSLYAILASHPGSGRSARPKLCCAGSLILRPFQLSAFF